jgi:hypothetical protein
LLWERIHLCELQRMVRYCTRGHTPVSSRSASPSRDACTQTRARRHEYEFPLPWKTSRAHTGARRDVQQLSLPLSWCGRLPGNAGPVGTDMQRNGSKQSGEHASPVGAARGARTPSFGDGGPHHPRPRPSIFFHRPYPPPTISKTIIPVAVARSSKVCPCLSPRS